MTDTAHRQTGGLIKSYAAWLYLSFICLALPAVIFAWLGWQLLLQSQTRVERGRIASDIYTALAEFDLGKAQLRNWSYRRALAQEAAPDERLTLLAQLETQASLIADKTADAARMDQARNKPAEDHANRAALLALLTGVIDKLRRETATITDDLAEIDAEFAQWGDIPLAEALLAARADEAALLTLERTRADDALAAARRLFITAGGFGGVATGLLAILLARRLHRPLRQLRAGVQSYQDTGFTYRLGPFLDREFSDLAAQLNAMAAEVQSAREAAKERNAALESQVALRTADLEQALAQLSAAEAARKQLLADMGHELRTPVTVIRGEAQIALRAPDADPARLRAALDRIIGVSRQMADLIEDLLTAVRDGANPKPLMLTDVTLPALLADAITASRSLGAARDISVTLAPAPADISLHSDPDRLRQLLICLLDNAIRYSAPGGQVTVSADHGSTGTIIAITDQGIGIAAEDLARIWDRGWRAPDARRHRADGLGLGLGIAQQLAADLGASLTLTSAGPGQGTTARLHLPQKAVA
jgi:two-component system OmpR family sensor kinase